jgi:surface protein
LNDIVGVSGALAANEAAYQAYIDANEGNFSTPATAAEVQAMVTSVNNAVTLLAAIGTDEDDGAATTTNATAAQLNGIIGVSGALAANEAAYQAYIDANESNFSSPATAAEVQAMVTSVNNAVTLLAAIGTDEEDGAATTTNATATQLNDIIGISAAVASNESIYQDYIDLNEGNFSAPATVSEVQTMLDVAVSMKIIQDYAVSNTNPAPTLSDYAKIGVVDAAGNAFASSRLNALNSIIDDATLSDVQTIAEVRALMTVRPIPTSIVGNGSTGVVTVTFDRDIDPTSVDLAGFALVSNGSATAISVSGNVVSLSVSPDVPENTTNVTVSVRTNVVKSADLGNSNNTTAANETSLDSLFMNSTSVPVEALTWKTSHATSASETFRNNANFNADITGWHVNAIKTMSSMFRDATSFNQDIGSWQVYALTNMFSMFRGASAFNQDIGGWWVNRVTNMDSTFSGATNFNQDLNSWNVANVDKMYGTFQNASSFNSALSNWNVGAVTDMKYMFNDAVVFNQDISMWNTSNVLSMTGMFDGAAAFNQSVNAWDVSSVQDLSYMFNDAVAFNQGLQGWDTSAATNMSGMFRRATSFNGDISTWDVAAVTNMSSMFNTALSFNQDITSWDVSLVQDMGRMLQNTHAFNQNLGSWNVQNVINMTSLFYGTTGMSKANMDASMRGWADVNVSQGEGALQNSVTVTAAAYSDATTVEYLQDTYSWTVSRTSASDSVEFDPRTTSLVMVGDGSAADTLNGVSSNSETFIGGNGTDTINANAGVDVIHGGRGNDTIDAGAGSDFIYGGSGDDALTGGSGADTFIFSFDNMGTDTITDFSDSTSDADKIDISTLLDIAAGTTIDGALLAGLGAYVTASEIDTNGDLAVDSTEFVIDGDGSGAGNSVNVTIILEGVTGIGDLATYIDNNFIL